MQEADNMIGSEVFGYSCKLTGKTFWGEHNSTLGLVALSQMCFEVKSWKPHEAPRVLGYICMPVVFYGIHRKDELHFKIDMCVSMVILHLWSTKNNINNSQST